MDSVLANEYFKGKNILITGSSGYIASGIINSLSKIDCLLYRVSRDVSKLDAITGQANIINFEFDIANTAKWSCVLEKIDFIYHLAAQTSSVKAGNDPILDYAVNVLPLVSMLMTCDKHNLYPSIVFAGTVTEIGLSDYLPVDENHYEKPVTIYDIHKLTAEKYLAYYSVLGRIKGCTLRLANVYGPGKKSSSSDRGILNFMIRKALKGEGLTVYGEGEYERDYLYIDDVVNAFLHAGANIDYLNGDHFIIGKGESSTVAELANLVADRVALKTGKRVPINFIPEPSGQLPIEKRNFVADSSKFKKNTGWHPEYDLIQGIDRTIEFFLQKT